VARGREYTDPDGWLSVAGLFFLGPGSNAIGSGAGATVALPSPAPAQAGEIDLREGRVFARAAPGVALTLNGRPFAGEVELRPATGDRLADRLGVGRLVLHVHRSGARLAIRLRDPDSALRRRFTGLAWFPVDRRWCVQARFEPHPAPLPVSIVNTVGDVVPLESPGRARFTIDGRTMTLLAVTSEGRLWFILTDRTAGTATYKIRYLYAEVPRDGRLTLDLNRIHNPPCAVNPHTTCPLPPKENQLDLPIAAGERLAPAPR
jgi:uncharacterized protein (DUF1684 family)